MDDKVKNGIKKGFLFAGEVGLSIVGLIADSISGSAKSRSRDRNFSEEQREKFSDMSDAYGNFAGSIHNSASSLREKRYGVGNDDYDSDYGSDYDSDYGSEYDSDDDYYD